MAFKGYLNIAGNPNFQTDISPSVLYNNYGQYLRVDYNWDIIGMCQVLVAGTYNDNWFSFEKYIYNPLPYWNFGNTTGLMEGYHNSDTNPYFTVDKGLVTHFENGSQTGVRQVSGNPFGNNNIQFFAGYGDATVHTRFYGLKISDAQGNVLVNFVADPNGIRDEVSGKVYNMTGSGSFEYVSLHVFNPDTNSVRFDQTGGTAIVNVEAETTWNITYDTDYFTVVKNDDSVTISAPVNETDQRKEMVITFTDADDFTFTVTVKQKGIQNGMPLHLGGLEVPTLMLGDTPITAAYLGEQQVFSTGPFIGLKVTKSIIVTPDKTTAIIKVKSSEPWLLSIDVDWLTVNATTGDAGTTEITLTCTKTDEEDATAEITFMSPSYEAICTVTYSPINTNAYLDISGQYDWYIPLDYVPTVETMIEITTNIRPEGEQASGRNMPNILGTTESGNEGILLRTLYRGESLQYIFANINDGRVAAGFYGKHHYIMDKTGIEVDGVKHSYTTSTTSMNKGALKLGYAWAGDSAAYGQFGVVNISENGEFVKSYYPAVDSDGNPCYKDSTTGNAFYPVCIRQGVTPTVTYGEWS